MIWLLKNRNQDVNEEFPILEAYVPVLDKEYSVKEIKDMCRFSDTPGSSWSELSKLVMMIQGIEFSYDSFMSNWKVEAMKINDIEFDFCFEFSFMYVKGSQKYKRYHKQISDVFEHLSLVKVNEITAEEIQRRVSLVREMFDNLVDSKIINIFFGNSYNVLLEKAEKNTKNLETVLNKIGKSFGDLLVYESDEEFLKKINETREAKSSLKKKIR